MAEVGDYIDSFGNRAPAVLKTELGRITAALNAA
jgi:hypothetical protein